MMGHRPPRHTGRSVTPPPDPLRRSPAGGPTVPPPKPSDIGTSKPSSGAKGFVQIVSHEAGGYAEVKPARSGRRPNRFARLPPDERADAMGLAAAFGLEDAKYEFHQIQRAESEAARAREAAERQRTAAKAKREAAEALVEEVGEEKIRAAALYLARRRFEEAPWESALDVWTACDAFEVAADRAIRGPILDLVDDYAAPLFRSPRREVLDPGPRIVRRPRRAWDGKRVSVAAIRGIGSFVVFTQVASFVVLGEFEAATVASGAAMIGAASTIEALR